MLTHGHPFQYFNIGSFFLLFFWGCKFGYVHWMANVHLFISIKNRQNIYIIKVLGCGQMNHHTEYYISTADIVLGCFIYTLIINIVRLFLNGVCSGKVDDCYLVNYDSIWCLWIIMHWPNKGQATKTKDYNLE